MKQTRQLKYWQGKFGDDYIKRNSDLSLFERRKVFFSKLLKNYPDIHSIIEIGCNIGGNLYVLQKINPALTLAGIEPNNTAVKKARKLIPSSQIINTSIFDCKFKRKYDLVFTSGVLIHIADRDLPLALKLMYEISGMYILSVEYFSKTTQTIPYRNLTDALYKRPYDQIWLAVLPQLQLIQTGLADKSSGFDNCHWWLYKKHD